MYWTKTEVLNKHLRGIDFENFFYLQLNGFS